MTINDNKLDALFKELVPPSGKAESLAGEIVRAMMRISYRNWNDGDHVGIGYGKETCNPAARFLLNKLPEDLTEYVLAIWGVYGDNAYDAGLDVLVGKVADYVIAHPELRNVESEDMFSFRDENEDVDDDDEDEDW